MRRRQTRVDLSRNASPTTLTEDSAITAAATIGDGSNPDPRIENALAQMQMHSPMLRRQFARLPASVIDHLPDAPSCVDGSDEASEEALSRRGW